MKTAYSPRILINTGMLLLAGALYAQTSEAPTWAHQDLVQADYTTPATRKTDHPYMRTLRATETGTYQAVVTDEAGITRMRGTFLDAAATVPDGHFEYFHANGQKESEGRFVKGLKTGQWLCWASDGSERAERHYLGMPWEDLQIWLGLAERAATLSEGAMAEANPL